jgi:hypothetical protein
MAMDTLTSVVEQPFQVRQPLMVSLIISSILTLICIVAYFVLPPQIPIFYSLPRSADQIAPKMWIILFPAFSLLVSLSHTILLGVFNSLDVMVLRVFGWMTAVLQLLLLSIVLRMIILVL